MPPAYLVHPTFLGQGCGAGVNPVMAARLLAAETLLRVQFVAAGSPGTFESWGGLLEPIIGWRPAAGFHSSGSAVDLNVTTNPYIATRTGAAFGGEAGTPNAAAVRRRAVEVYDRAVAFGGSIGDKADASIRVNDTIEFTYDRFRLISDSLSAYLGLVFSKGATHIRRPPIANVQTLPDASPSFNAIPLTERLDPIAGVIATTARMADFGWIASHVGWPFDPIQMYWQILRDYEMVRTPMLFGKASLPVTETRNPARGFLDLRKEVVVTLVGNKVMRWGASDFGAAASGDMMHFDLGNDAGFIPQDT